MVETSGSWLREQQFPLESFTFRNCMIEPVEHRQHEFLPASINPFRVSNLGLNGLGYPGLPERGLTHEANDLIGKCVSHSQAPLLTANEYLEEQTSLLPARIDVPTSTYGTSSPQQKKFLIFDQSGIETRLVFSSLCPPRLHNQQFLAYGQPKKMERACIKTPVVYEESDENETIDEGSEMREDTEEINALLYSDGDGDGDGDDDDDFDPDCDDDDDEVSTGHSPLVNREEQEEKDFDEVANFDRCSKRQKALDGGHYYHGGGDLIHALDNDGVGPTIGNKRPRKDNKIRDTLRVLESIIPGVKNKEPLVILDEGISYLKSLKSGVLEMSSMEDPDSSSCYGPSN